jgi:hypothetical protein
MGIQRKIHSLLVTAMMLIIGNSSMAQYDLKATWNEYDPGSIVDDDPFFGSFTIMNYGDNTIPAGDTIWYGYIINGEQYDKELNLGLVSGIVLEEDFNPEEERSIYNPIVWPLWGSGDTIDVCAVVYGVGVESYTGEFHSGDSDPENNETCVQAIMPTYFVGMQDHSNPTLDYIYVNPVDRMVQIKLEHGLQQTFHIQLMDISGQVVKQTAYNAEGQDKLEFLYADNMPNGVYFIHMSYLNYTITKKVFINNF